MKEMHFHLTGGKPLGEIVAPLLAWYRKNARVLPWRENTDPYRVWVSEIMLQQTRVDTVIPYYNRFLQALPDLAALAAADPDRLLKLWEGLGYYSRVRNMQRAAQQICQQNNGRFPQDFDAVRALPGIGDYTAGAICSIAFEARRAAVDGNVLRVISRLCASNVALSDPALKPAVTKALQEVYPEKHRGDFTQSLMELGATICLPNGEPLCDRCPLAALCAARACGRPTEFPPPQIKRPRKKESYTVFLLRCGSKIALTRREQPGVLHNMWQLPCAPGRLTPTEAAAELARHGLSLSPECLCEKPPKKHIFTHIEWQLFCYEASCQNPVPAFVWASPEDLAGHYSLPTAFRKLLP